MKEKTARGVFCLLAILLLFSSLLPAAAAAEEAAPAAEAYTLVLPIITAADDLEELVSDGTADAGSFDIELGYEDPGGEDTRAQIVGLRFPDLPVLSGAVVTEAYIQFTVDEVKYPADPFDVSITVEDAADAAPFGDGDTAPRYALSSRVQMALCVNWASGDDNKVVWNTTGKAGKAQRTPDLSALVQAVIDREDWAYGNAVAFQIAGIGNRTAYAYERDSFSAAALHLSFTIVNADQPAPQGLAAAAPTTLFEDNGVNHRHDGADGIPDRGRRRGQVDALYGRNHGRTAVRRLRGALCRKDVLQCGRNRAGQHSALRRRPDPAARRRRDGDELRVVSARFLGERGNCTDRAGNRRTGRRIPGGRRLDLYGRIRMG